MKSVMFKPWEGVNYANGYKGKKILILGESHYCDGCKPDVCEEPSDAPDCDLQNFTRDMIINHINKTNKRTFVTKLENALKEAMDFTDASQNVFDYVAYYDYIQQIVAPSPGIAPKKEMWENAQEPFLEVLENLKPDFMLVLSERLWNNMPGETNVDWPLFKEISIDGKVDRIYWSGPNKELPLRMYSFHPRTNMFRDIIPFLKEALKIITTEL